VEELVRNRVEEIDAAGLDRRGRRENRGVAMFHAVASRPRQVIGDERKCVPFVRRVLAKHTQRFAHNRLHVARQRVEIGFAAGVMHRETEHRRAQ
jgi:hypothetical protein